MKSRKYLLLLMMAIITGLLLIARYGNAYTSNASAKEEGTSGRFALGQPPMNAYSNLIVVTGHSILRYNHTDINENEGWYLLPYQKIPGQAESFVEHIKIGIKEAEKDEKAILLFSGGSTRMEAGPMTEGQSYWTVAEEKNWFGNNMVRTKAFTENFARDSFENVLFSICRFKELSGQYPRNITVVSYNFKEKRFVDIHREAICFPLERFHFIGIDYPEEGLAEAMKGEAKVVRKFEADPYGIHGDLKHKIFGRDPFVQGAHYTISCPELYDLLHYTAYEPFPGDLPW